MGAGASRSSNLRGFLDPLDASDRVDVATVLPRIEVLRPCERPPRSHLRRRVWSSVRSVDLRVLRDRRLANTWVGVVAAVVAGIDTDDLARERERSAPWHRPGVRRRAGERQTREAQHDERRRDGRTCTTQDHDFRSLHSSMR